MVRVGLNYAVEQRIRLIDMLLAHYGSIRRGIIMDFYGISMPQASNDLGLYAELAPGNMTYDLKAKAYLRTPQFERLYPDYRMETS